MSNACALRLVRFSATVMTFASFSCAHLAMAQGQAWKTAPNGLVPMLGAESFAPPVATPPLNPRPNTSQRAPLAHLIENPDQSAGAPPFALTDQTGTIQRYVEPVPGIDLAAHVGQTVVVRHDTGLTLLASQLELPPRPLHAMARDSRAVDRAPQSGRSFADNGVQQAQYVDDDDSTVQLLPDDMQLPGGSPGMGNAAPLEMLGPGGGYPGGYPNQMMSPEMCGPNCDPQFCDPMQCGPDGMQPYGQQMTGPCPNCGQYHNDTGYGPQGGYEPSGNSANTQGVQLSGDVEFLFLRPRITEDVTGKLTESYELSPRFILGVQNLGNLDGRVRYWHYGRDTEALNGDIRLEFDVLDIEAVHRFEGRRSDVALAAGIRLAHLQLSDINDEKSATDLIGLTLAADGLTRVARFSSGYCGWVYGGRFSILGGDWGGDDNSVFVNQEVRDDNVLASELYVGAEVARRCGNVDVRGRVVFELQNWHSDVLDRIAGIESIGFLGPALQIGADF